MSFLQEFRKFAMRGNVVDLAVGIIIGAAFGNIVSSLVAHVIMPPLGLLIGGIDFKQFSWVLKPAQGNRPAAVMEYGIFLQNVFDFFIVSFAVFCIVKLINRMHNKEEEETPNELSKQSAEEILLTEIRDILKKILMVTHGEL
ncbi:Large-conductance mechanosensitive channel [Candidatus Moranella endobia PCVAL]|uniref:Large-conductance mechanosensitive channel n=1 Tax=Moranella endobia (strain PCIT) TaxID=903503 RepID=F7XY01_MOREP|nr:large-conductance mechanosensitive channel protein MscL [Candidatus Moranella endobia]AEI74977.1 large-conductance mechanosensitive channel [Candidatus Moranella endobia PCIT]AGJ61225.1 Large-conductance mechanosensitive channel [Candidatus Moranella endobia PCVAL]